MYDEPERPKTANLEKPSILDPDLVDKLDMSLLSKESLIDSITQHRLLKTSGETSSFPSSSRYRQNVIGTEQQREQYSLVLNGEATWCNPFSLRHKRRSFEHILDSKLGHIDMSRMQKQSCIGGQNMGFTKKNNTKLDDNNNRFVIDYFSENLKIQEFNKNLVKILNV